MSESLKSSLGLKYEARDKVVNHSGYEKLLSRFTVQRMSLMESFHSFPARPADISLAVGEELLAVQTNARKDEVEHMHRCTRHKVLPEWNKPTHGGPGYWWTLSFF